MIPLDEQLTGQWCSAPFDAGAMETSELVLLACGRGWSRFESFSGELSVGRFAWRLPSPGLLELRYTWRVSGRWAESGDGFDAVHSSRPDDELLRTGYRITTERPPLSGEPVTALRLDVPVEYAEAFALGRRTVTTADDPSSTVAPYEPSVRPPLR
ncbi:hypothetical protein ACSNOH_27945 [Streptomyces sp. URMC 127]|uniref:hypothetical protein n=1 Tax=Streptomyces sp. URMC 127 TaxID=3423402 RepID=UPI003F193FFE